MRDHLLWTKLLRNSFYKIRFFIDMNTFEILVKRSKFLLKFLVKDRNSVQKWKVFSKMESFFNNENFVQQWKFLWKIEILVENRNCVQKSKFCSKIEILFKDKNFVQRLKFCSKIEILLKMKFCSKLSAIFSIFKMSTSCNNASNTIQLAIFWLFYLVEELQWYVFWITQKISIIGKIIKQKISYYKFFIKYQAFCVRALR